MSPVLAGRYFAAEALSVLELSTMDTSLKAIFFFLKHYFLVYVQRSVFPEQNNSTSWFK